MWLVYGRTGKTDHDAALEDILADIPSVKGDE